MNNEYLEQLDLMVLKEVMGYKGDWDGPPTIARCYSRYLQDAWNVLNKLIELDWSVNVYNVFDMLGKGKRWGVNLSDDDLTSHGPSGTGVISIRGPITEIDQSLPLAICRAAIRAVANPPIDNEKQLMIELKMSGAFEVDANDWKISKGDSDGKETS